MFGRKLGTIRSRLLIGFALIALIPVFSSAVGSAVIGISGGRKQAQERLASIALSKETAVQGWIDALHQELVAVSTTDCSYERIWVVVSLARDNFYYDFYNSAVRNRLQAFVTQSSLFEEMFLVDVNGRVVVSTDLSQEGRDVSQETFFQQGLQTSAAILPFYHAHARIQDLTSVYVSQPIVGNEQVVGVVAGLARVDDLTQILTERTGLGQTGKAYLVDVDGDFLAGKNPAGVSNGKLELGPDLADVLRGQNDGFDTYIDMNGKRVIGAFRWLSDFSAMLFVEQNQTEVLANAITTLGINAFVALAALILAVSLAATIMRDIADPLQNLVTTAAQIADGDLDQYATVEREDEIGTLARSFNSMTLQLRSLINELEQRVEERTSELQRLALQLKTSAQVSREVTSILSIDGLLAKVTELIHFAFGYYAVHIYLVDEEAGSLVCRASSTSMPPQDPTLEINANSLNGEVARTGQSLLVNDVTQEYRFMPDKNYPYTSSELVIPLSIGKRCLGTLDLLSQERGAFKPEDVDVAQSLASQIAIAIENARLYERSQELAVLEERNRLARDLHDAMNQSLYSIVLFAGAAHKEADKLGAEAVQRHLVCVEDTAKQALKEMRLMLFELRPYSLQERGWIGSLQKRLDTVEGSAGIDVDLEVCGEIDLPECAEEILYHIIQEALNNTLKHASASTVRVAIRGSDSQLEVTVRDNGLGFEPASRPCSGGMGLTSMYERAEQLGALLEVKSAPGEGTCVRVVVDLSARSQDDFA
ncbi:MAG: GAF domain-containing protein [Anaerolineales bacterium]|nr:GAF domain-containing protein [Anaerolineales bacterium]